MEKKVSKTIDKLLSIVKKDKNIDLILLDQAIKFAEFAHKGQLRDSGEPFILHPLHVAILIAELKMDTTSIISAILHDVIEDTSTSIDIIKEKFGHKIAQMVNGLTKLSKIEDKNTPHCKEKEKIENYRNLMCAVSKDFRVIIIKLADRLHNMQTLHHIKSKAKRLRIATETMEIHSALAERIGLHKYKNELQELAFEELYRHEKKGIELQMRKMRNDLGSSIKKIVSQIQETIKKQKVKSLHVSGREKQLCSIWRKLQNKRISFEDLTDIFAFRVVVDTTDECYKALYAIHQEYHMVPGEFKDYISTPKTNGYQSLHTVIIGPENKRIEVQIRTESMHKIAEYGIAAHWQYKEKVLDDESLQNFSWMSEFLGILEHSTNPSEILQDSKLEIHYHQVFCFTQKGQLIALPGGSTALDFAFYVDAERALKCKEIIINKEIVPFHYEIQNGEQIFINYSSNLKVSDSWLRLVKTGKSKKLLQSFLNNDNEFSEIKNGEKILINYLKKHKISFNREIIKKNALKFYNSNNLDNFFKSIFLQEIDLAKFIAQSGLTNKKRFNLRKIFSNSTNDKKFSSNIILSKCCYPIRDDIAFYMLEDNCCSVHRKECRKIKLRNNKNIINFDWRNYAQKIFETKIIISFKDQTGILNEILTFISENKINIKEIKAIRKYENYAECSIVIDVENLLQLENFLATVKNINPVHNAFRIVDN